MRPYNKAAMNFKAPQNKNICRLLKKRGQELRAVQKCLDTRRAMS